MASIYVASLSDYNAGILHGEWIDLSGSSIEDVEAQIQSMLNASPEAADNVLVVAEEWAIHDYDGFDGMNLGEHEDIAKLIAVSELVEQHNAPAVAAWVNHEGLSSLEADSMADGFQEAYEGEFSSVEDFAAEFLDETGAFYGVDEFLQSYFDYEKYANDLVMGGEIWVVETGWNEVHIFQSR